LQVRARARDASSRRGDKARRENWRRDREQTTLCVRGNAKEDSVAKGQVKQNKSNKTKLSTKEKQKKKKEKQAKK
jgi:hypothetical protein